MRRGTWRLMGGERGWWSGGVVGRRGVVVVLLTEETTPSTARVISKCKCPTLRKSLMRMWILAN